MFFRRTILTVALGATLLTSSIPATFAQDEATESSKRVFMPLVVTSANDNDGVTNLDEELKQNRPDLADDTDKHSSDPSSSDQSPLVQAAEVTGSSYVGVIPDKDRCPAGSEKIVIHTDDEDTRNRNNSSGWIGATLADHNTTYTFCKVDGDQFKPLASGQRYAVLSLSAQCPAGARSISHQQDNEDRRTQNWYQGNIYPNFQGVNTIWVFCDFNGRTPTMSTFPNIGISYGVFANGQLVAGQPTGYRATDDENTRNHNWWNPSEIPGIFFGGRDTTMNFARVQSVDGCPLLTENLTSNRSNGLPNNRLQAVVWYDGDMSSTPTLEIEYLSTSGNTGWINIGGSADPAGRIQPFDQQIETREYDITSCQITGKIRVNGVTPNGMIDGIAVGLYVKDSRGLYRLLRSRSTQLNTTSDFVGSWPLGLDDTTFGSRTPQITDGFASGTARMIITSAKYLPNGEHQLR